MGENGTDGQTLNFFFIIMKNMGENGADIQTLNFFFIYYNEYENVNSRTSH